MRRVRASWGAYLWAVAQLAGASVVLAMLLAGLWMPRWVQFAVTICLFTEALAIAVGELRLRQAMQEQDRATVQRWLR